MAGVRAIAAGQTRHNLLFGIPATRQTLAEEANRQLDSMPLRAAVARCRELPPMSFPSPGPLDDRRPNWLPTCCTGPGLVFCLAPPLATGVQGSLKPEEEKLQTSWSDRA